MADSRIKEKIKKDDKAANNKKSQFSKENETKLLEELSIMKGYKNTFSSMPSKTKSKVNKYLKEWFKTMPFYIAIKYDLKKKKNMSLAFGVTKDLNTAATNKKIYQFDSKKSASYNKTKYMQFLNKNKMAKSGVEVLTLVRPYINNNEANPDIPNAYENNMYIYFFMKT